MEGSDKGPGDAVGTSDGKAKPEANLDDVAWFRKNFCAAMGVREEDLDRATMPKNIEQADAYYLRTMNGITEIIRTGINDFMTEEAKRMLLDPEKMKVMAVLFNQYQRLAEVTARTDLDERNMIGNVSMGLAGESGEFLDLVKKHLFHDHPIDKDEIKKELGDVLWYVAMCARVFGLTLGEVAVHNVERLSERYPNGFSTEKSINRKEYVEEGK